MVDILQFLHQTPVRGDKRPLEVLLARRPDLEHILLECKNTNTVMPYIDLVNEVLEDAVMRLTAAGSFEDPDLPTEVPDPRAPADEVAAYRVRVAHLQTTWEADCLRAEPEHERLEAYATVATAAYPWNVAINPAMERAYFFLDYLGIDLFSMWERFDQPYGSRIIAYFRLTYAEWLMMTRKLDSADLPPAALEVRVAGLWGVELGASGSEDRSLVGLLSCVSTFLDRSGLTFEDLKELIDARFLYREKIDPETSRPVRLPSLGLAPLPGTDPCDIDNWRISRLDLDMLEVLHRFLRLLRRVGWSVKFFANALSIFDFFWDREDFVAHAGRLAMHLGLLATRLGRSVEDVLALYQLPEEQRHDAWAKAFGLADFQFDRFLMLLGVDPYDSVEGTRTMLDELEIMRATPFDFGELLYILQHKDQSPPQFAPRRDDLTDFLRNLHGFALTAVAEGPESSEPGETVRRRQVINATVRESMAQFLNLDADVAGLLLGVDEEGRITEDRVLHDLEGTDQAIAETIHQWIEETEFGSGEVSDDAFEPALTTLICLDKAARLIRGLEINGRQLRIIHARRADNKFLDLNDLPVADEPPMAPLFDRTEAFIAIVQAKQLQKTLPRDELDLFDLMQEAAGVVEEVEGADLDRRTELEQSFFDLLERHLGWIPDDVKALRGLHRGFESFLRWMTFQKIEGAHRLARRARVPVADVGRWLKDTWIRRAEELLREAEAIQQRARAKHHTEEAWYRTLTAFNDDLREKRRDALLHYLMHNAKDDSGNPLFADTADVFAYFLIDPEMSSCQLTSRIKRANSTLQLFIQRCLMGLETDVEPDRNLPDPERPFWDRWIWMRNYRVWEANRKVFLYPENWIEPDLRDDKTPFFRELETELLQDELTEATAEQAYITYLDKLEEVARLDVRGLYHEEDRDVLHVFARTRSEPYVYYYRHRRANRTWTPWEKLDLNIEGDHLIPVVHNRRLILFWAVFKEAGEYWDLNIYWSEYRQNRWGLRKAASTDPLLRLQLGGIDQELVRFKGIPNNYFLFKAIIDEDTNDLAIYLYTAIDIRGETFTIPAEDRSTSRTGVEYLSGSTDRPYSLAIFTFKYCQQSLLLDHSEKPFWFTFQPTYKFDQMQLLNPRSIGLKIYKKISGEDHYELRGAPSSGDLHLGAIPSMPIPQLSTWSIKTWVERRKLERETPIDLFATLAGVHRIIYCHQSRHFTGQHPFVFENIDHTLLFTPMAILSELRHPMASGHFGETIVTSYETKYFLEFFYNSFVCDFILTLRRTGIKGLLAPTPTHFLDRQNAKLLEPLKEFKPTNHTIAPTTQDIDFTTTGAYSSYNWELFFHIPLMIAVRFSKDHKFEEAHRWFHYIFDVTDTSLHEAPEKYWRVKPFYELAKKPPGTLLDLLRRIARGEETEQIRVWREDPFNPHAIARLRIVAYMKNVVMKYLDNLIAWGDYLFQRSTIETINEATQYYIIASEIIGDPLTRLPARESVPLSYAVVRPRRAGDRFVDPFSNIWREAEDWLPVDLEPRRPSRGSVTPPVLHPYFCIPSNPKLQEYCDTIRDRLFKIRNCMDIEGRVRTLPLFEPPIDPALLVRARASGLDLRTALCQVTAARLPHYRFAYCYRKALEFANEVQAFGSALLSALEKKDAEELALLRAGHEAELLSSIRATKQQQVEEAREALNALEVAREVMVARKEFYASRPFMNSSEGAQLDLMLISTGLQMASSLLETSASFAHGGPDQYVGGLLGGIASGAITLTKMPTGSSIGSGLQAAARSLSMISSFMQTGASMAGIIGGYQQRKDDWRFQADQAEIELGQIDKQIAAAEIRLAIAEKDLENHEKQIDQSRQVQDHLRSKFTNLELQNWRGAQLSALHYQAYQMAYKQSLDAQRAAQYELGREPSDFSYIEFGHWDSGRKGLLAGERLQQQLRRLDMAYMDRNERELEIIKHVSLTLLEPAQLIQLRETGACEIRLPEVLFDLDFPGHYFRRIKSVSLTVACVTGPYTSVNATLRLISSKLRRESLRDDTLPDPDLDTEYGGSDAIAVSSAQNDSGLFELNFRDERYLPFEGAGVISNWLLELPPKDMAAFDYDSIADVVMHLRYTARDGGPNHKARATRNLRERVIHWLKDLATNPVPLVCLFSLRQEFPSELHSFLYPRDESHATVIQIGENRFPYVLRKIIPEEQFDLSAHVVVKPKQDAHRPFFEGLVVRLGSGAELSSAELTSEATQWGALPHAEFTPPTGSGSAESQGWSTTPLAHWRLTLSPVADATGFLDEIASTESNQRLDPAVIEDIFLAFGLEKKGP